MWEKSSRQVLCACWLLAFPHRLQCQAPASMLGLFTEMKCLWYFCGHAAAMLATPNSRLHSRNHPLSPHAAAHLMLEDS